MIEKYPPLPKLPLTPEQVDELEKEACLLFEQRGEPNLSKAYRWTDIQALLLEAACLKKSLKDCTKHELMALQFAAKDEMQDRLLQSLQDLGDEYVDLYGSKEGIERMGEDLCRRVANGRHPEGWPGIIRYLIKISG